LPKLFIVIASPPDEKNRRNRQTRSSPIGCCYISQNGKSIGGWPTPFGDASI